MAKRIRLLALAAALLVLGASIAGVALRPTQPAHAQLWTDGVSAADLPTQEGGGYTITTPEQFAALVWAYNTQDPVLGESDRVNVTLGASLDFTGKQFVPLGTADRPFNGILRGRGYAIRGIQYPEVEGESYTVAAPIAYLGQAGEVYELAVETALDHAARTRSAGIVGDNSGVVRDSFVYLTPSDSEGSMAENGLAGGVVALNRGTGKIYSCHVSGTVRDLGKVSYGGIAGDNQGAIAYVYSAERVQGSEAFLAEGRVAASSENAIYYAYYLTDDARPDVTAVEGTPDVDSEDNYVGARTQQQLGTLAVNALFPASSAVDALMGRTVSRGWVKTAPLSDNGTTYNAPNLSIFNNNDASTSALLRRAIQLRRFGDDPDATADWGSAENPYLIGDVAQWTLFAQNVSAGYTYEGRTFRLQQNVDFAGEEAVQAGYYRNTFDYRSFAGTFDGGGNALQNFTLNAPREYTGLFGYLTRTGTVTALLVDGATVTGDSHVGVLVGYAEGTVTGVHVKDATVTGRVQIGGVAGQLSSARLTHVLSTPLALESTSSTATQAAYGVAGEAYNVSDSDVWYVTRTDARFRTPLVGSVLEVDRNGSLSAEMWMDSADFSIQFNATPNAEEGWTNVSYRTDAEQEVASGNRWTPAGVSATGNHLYVRFTRSFLYRFGDAGSAGDEITSALESMTATGTTAREGLVPDGAYYYEGQPIVVSVTPKDGYYVSDARAYSHRDSLIRDESVVPQFSRSAQAGEVLFSFTVGATTRRLELSATPLNAHPVAEDNRERAEGLVQFVKEGESPEQEQPYTLPVGQNPILYNGSAVTYTWDSADHPGFAAGYTWSSGSAAPVDAGQHTLTISITDEQGNFRGRARLSFEISPRPLAVPRAGLVTTREYDGGYTAESEVNMALVKNLCERDRGSIAIDARATYLTSGVGSSNASFAFTLKGARQSNYTLITPTLPSVNVEIVKRELQLQLLGKLEKSYDGQAPSFSYGFLPDHSPVANEPATIRFTYVREGEDGALITGYPAGTYFITPILVAPADPSNPSETLLEHPNYRLTTATFSYIISPRQVEAGFVIPDSMVYDPDIDYRSALKAYYLAVNGGRVYLDAHVQRNVGDADAEDWQDVTEVKEAGTYRLCVEGIDDPNYSLTGDLFRVFTLSPAPQGDVTLVPTKDPVEGPYTYGMRVALTCTGGVETIPAAYAFVPEEGQTLQPGEDGMVTLLTPAGTPVATLQGNVLHLMAGDVRFRVVAARDSDPNYQPAQSEPVLFEVDKCPLNVALLGNMEVDYGTDPEPQWVITGWVEGDADLFAAGGAEAVGLKLPTLMLAREGEEPRPFTPGEQIAAGTYQVTLSGGEGRGYTLSLSSDAVTLTVNKRAVNVVVCAGQSHVYGDAAPDPDRLLYQLFDPTTGEELSFRFSVGQLACDIGTDAGDYPITRGTLGEGDPNLTLNAFTGANYTVTPRPLTVWVVEKHKAYGQPDPAVEYGCENLAAGDALDAVLTGEPVREAGEDAFRNGVVPASYRYTAGTLAVTGNYTLAWRTTPLYVDPAAVQFGPERDLQVEYGQALSELSPACAALGVHSEPLAGAFVWEQPDLVPDFTHSDTQTCLIRFLPEDQNYRTTQLELTLRIHAFVLTLQLGGSTTLTYDGTVRTPIQIAYQSDAPEGLDPALTGSYSAPVCGVGTYTFRVTLGNHYFTLQGNSSATITVRPAPLTISVQAVRHAPDQTPTPVFTYEGFVAGEDASVLLTPPQVSWHTQLGSYAVTPTAATAANYAITYRAGNEVVFAPQMSCTPEAGESALEWQGEWEQGATVSYKLVGADAVAEDKQASAVYAAIEKLAGASPEGLYLLSVTGNGIGTQLALTLPADEARTLKSVVVVAADGTAVAVEFTAQDGVVRFDAGADVVAFALLFEQAPTPFDWQRWLVPIAALAVVVVVLMIVLIVLTKRRKKNEDAILGRKK